MAANLAVWGVAPCTTWPSQRALAPGAPRRRPHPQHRALNRPDSGAPGLPDPLGLLRSAGDALGELLAQAARSDAERRRGARVDAGPGTPQPGPSAAAWSPSPPATSAAYGADGLLDSADDEDDVSSSGRVANIPPPPALQDTVRDLRSEVAATRELVARVVRAQQAVRAWTAPGPAGANGAAGAAGAGTVADANGAANAAVMPDTVAADAP